MKGITIKQKSGQHIAQLLKIGFLIYSCEVCFSSTKSLEQFLRHEEKYSVEDIEEKRLRRELLSPASSSFRARYRKSVVEVEKSFSVGRFTGVYTTSTSTPIKVMQRSTRKGTPSRWLLSTISTVGEASPDTSQPSLASFLERFQKLGISCRRKMIEMGSISEEKSDGQTYVVAKQTRAPANTPALNYFDSYLSVCESSNSLVSDLRAAKTTKCGFCGLEFADLNAKHTHYVQMHLEEIFKKNPENRVQDCNTTPKMVEQSQLSSSSGSDMVNPSSPLFYCRNGHYNYIPAGVSKEKQFMSNNSNSNGDKCHFHDSSFHSNDHSIDNRLITMATPSNQHSASSASYNDHTSSLEGHSTLQTNSTAPQTSEEYAEDAKTPSATPKRTSEESNSATSSILFATFPSAQQVERETLYGLDRFKENLESASNPYQPPTFISFNSDDTISNSNGEQVFKAGLITNQTSLSLELTSQSAEQKSNTGNDSWINSLHHCDDTTFGCSIARFLQQLDWKTKEKLKLQVRNIIVNCKICMEMETERGDKKFEHTSSGIERSYLKAANFIGPFPFGTTGKGKRMQPTPTANEFLHALCAPIVLEEELEKEELEKKKEANDFVQKICLRNAFSL